MRDDLDELRRIEGFPIGEDEDLHALSDPPHYTAYPNPHIAEFIQRWGKPYDEETDDYHREPYVADVSEGKRDPIYVAHTYHTKVPYKAIIPFLEHYTRSGDVVFDGYCGTGMTGIAAQMTGRRAVLVDLSPIATFIAFNYTAPVDVGVFDRDANRILCEIEAECGWMYETWHPHCNNPNRVKGRINHTIWSDVFVCPYCEGEIVFWEAAVDADIGRVRGDFPCPDCGAQLTKKGLSRATDYLWDSALGREVEQAKQVPVRINYSIGRRRHEKKPDADDLALIDRIKESEIPYWYPVYRMPEGDEARRNDPMGLTHTHHFYTRRNLWVLAAFWHHAGQTPDLFRHLRFIFTSAHHYVLRLCRLHVSNYFHGGGGVVDKPLEGTLYLPSISVETNAVYRLRLRSRVSRAFAAEDAEACLISTHSTTALGDWSEDTCDYIFTDPPFGKNLMYSELNFLWEAWLRVFTNNRPEAIINQTQGKALNDYRQLMTRCFAEMYRILKPGRWITVVFHNSKASVWNAIQDALAKAGFLVAQVTVMDKQLGTFKQVTSPGAVKNDLIINAYKPRARFSEQFVSEVGRGLEPEFVRQHLSQLPVAANLERSKEMLYSKYLAYYVQRGYLVAYNAERFYRALPQWGLVERDGYWFADEDQTNEYERRKAELHGDVSQAQAVLFISDERSARQWLWHFLESPRTYDDVYTSFVKALQTSEDQIPELTIMLDEGFVRTDGRWKRPDALTREELEASRQARLLRQFEEYLATARAGQRLKEVRKEALVAGFTEAYRASSFRDILTVGRRLHKRLLESSPDLRDFIEIAEAKVEAV